MSKTAIAIEQRHVSASHKVIVIHCEGAARELDVDAATPEAAKDIVDLVIELIKGVHCLATRRQLEELGLAPPATRETCRTAAN